MHITALARTPLNTSPSSCAAGLGATIIGGSSVMGLPVLAPTPPLGAWPAASAG